MENAILNFHFDYLNPSLNEDPGCVLYNIEWILNVRSQELLMFLMSSLVVDVADAMELYVEEGVDDSSVTA